jgi:hypothetical protein
VDGIWVTYKLDDGTDMVKTHGATWRLASVVLAGLQIMFPPLGPFTSWYLYQILKSSAKWLAGMVIMVGVSKSKSFPLQSWTREMDLHVFWVSLFF